MSAVDPQRELNRRWVETWRDAGPALEAVRRQDADSVTIEETVRQLFEGMESVLTAPAPATSGLVEQQMWFNRIRIAAENRKSAGPGSEE